MDPTTRSRLSLALLLSGGAVAAIGAAMYLTRRRGGLGGLGRIEPKERLRAGNMVLAHYRGNMPINKRVGLIQDLVWRGVRQPQMRELALAITGAGERTVTVGKRTFRVKGANCPARDGKCEAAAIGDWVFSNIRYTGDISPVKMGRNGPIEGVDLFQGSWRTIEFGGGDCDDHSNLVSTLLSLNGVPAKLRVTAPTRTDEWAHIYAMAGLPKTRPSQWFAVDTTLTGYRFGKEAPWGKRADFAA